ncbi:MAG: hypothetical protein ACO28P_10695 [Ilumatobacteraceae bacterium]
MSENTPLPTETPVDDTEIVVVVEDDDFEPLPFEDGEENDEGDADA